MTSTRLGQALLCCLALVICARAGVEAEPKTAYLAKNGEKCDLLIVNNGESKSVASTDANWLSWNSQGSRIALHRAPAGGLSVWREGKEGLVEVSKTAEGPRWSPDGSKLLFRRSPGNELCVYVATVVGSEPLTIAKDVRCAEWSPDGSRIAYATRESIWICDATGENPRENITGRTAVALAWAPTGRSLALIEPGLGKGMKPTLMTTAVNGSSGARKTLLDATDLAWSPNGTWVAAQTASGVEVVDLTTGKMVSTAGGLRGPVSWAGARRLVGFKDGAATQFLVGDNKFAPVPKPEGKTIVHAGMVAPLYVSDDMILSDPFRQAPKAGPGKITLRGSIVAMEPLEDQLTIAVETLIDANGERHFNHPIEQVVQIDPVTVRIAGDRSRPLRSVDIKLDDEVSLIAKSEKLDAHAVLSLVSAVIAGDIIPEVGTQPSKNAPHIRGDDIEYDGVSMQKVIVPMTFPVMGKVWYQDWFLASRGGGTRRHHGQDLMAKKLTPLVACFDGHVVVGKARPGGHMTLRIHGANGWTACYYHVNNDNPGTNDGNGGETFAFAPGLKTGQYVYEGQFIGYVGNSGNAEHTDPHCHFELWDDRFGAVVNAYPSLKNATKLTEPRYVAPAPDLIPATGEARVDGIVRKVDTGNETLKLQLIARYVKGRMRVVTFPTGAWGKMGPGSQLQLRGRKNVPIAPGDLRTGLQGTLVGVPKDQAIQTRIGAFERAD